MSETPRRRRPPRRERSAGHLPQRPWRPLEYRCAPVELLSADQVEHIHRAALAVLAEVGMKVLGAEARAAYRAGGFEVDDDSQRVRFDPAGVEEWVARAPAEFALRARNPAKSLRIGGRHAAFCSTSGPAYAMDLDGGRRAGTHAELCDFMRVVQALDVLHIDGGGGFEALDLPPATRHLDLFLACTTLLDKCWAPWTIGRAQTLDALEMAARSFGTDREGLARAEPVFLGVINTNSPLQLDIPMAEGLMTMAEHGQASAVTPFTLCGAMAPVTLAGALAQQHAEALAGIALAQIVRPGAPVMYGGFTSNVDMKTGSPAFGTPEYTQAAQISGQLARRIGVPFRSSNVTAANAPDAQSAWESMMSLWGAMTGHAHVVKHAAGWLCGGLAASFEKLVLDAEMLQLMAAWLEPPEVSDVTLALDAIREVGPGGHFFGTAHTLARYETAFHAPMVSNWDNYDTWIQHGAVTAERRANAAWKQLLAEYEQPPIDAGVEESLRDYVARRKAETRAG